MSTAKAWPYRGVLGAYYLNSIVSTPVLMKKFSWGGHRGQTPKEVFLQF